MTPRILGIHHFCCVFLYLYLVDYCACVAEGPYRRYAAPFGPENCALVEAALAEYPKLLAVVNQVRSHPSVASWIQKREELGFVW